MLDIDKLSDADVDRDRSAPDRAPWLLAVADDLTPLGLSGEEPLVGIGSLIFMISTVSPPQCLSVTVRSIVGTR